MSPHAIAAIVYISGFFISWFVNRTLVQLNHKWGCDNDEAVMLYAFWPLMIIVVIAYLAAIGAKECIDWPAKKVAVIIQRFSKK